MLSFEHRFWLAGFEKILGMDEAGRGPLAGPVCIAGVVFSPFQKNIPDGINDSKKLTKAQRERLFDAICATALAYKIIFISHKRIDEINILGAVKEGMRKIAQELQPDFVLSDAVAVNIMDIPQLALIGGDSLSVSIAAASILAKVSRDREMDKLAQKYPEYGFEKHAGYGTKTHMDAIAKHGLSPVHRKSFNCGI